MPKPAHRSVRNLPRRFRWVSAMLARLLGYLIDPQADHGLIGALLRRTLLLHLPRYEGYLSAILTLAALRRMGGGYWIGVRRRTEIAPRKHKPYSIRRLGGLRGLRLPPKGTIARLTALLRIACDPEREIQRLIRRYTRLLRAVRQAPPPLSRAAPFAALCVAPEPTPGFNTS